MAAAPLAALDLPLKVLVWADRSMTMISYTAAAALAARYRLPQPLADRLAGIDALTDAVISTYSESLSVPLTEHKAGKRANDKRGWRSRQRMWASEFLVILFLESLLFGRVCSQVC
jgi:hypothetical protein